MEQQPRAARIGSRVIDPRTAWLLKCLLAAFFLLALGEFTFAALGAGTPKPKNVLILSSFSKGLIDPSLEPLKSTLISRVSGPVNFYVEYLDSQRFGNRDYENGVSESLGDAYAKEKPDVVIAIGYAALQFAAEFRDRIFPGVPIVFAWVASGRIQGRPLWPGVTGITVSEDVRGTVDLAVRLHPQARNVAVISGDSAFDTYWLGLTRQELHNRAEKLTEIDLAGLPAKQLLQRVSTLPTNTIVLFQLLPKDSSEQVVGAFDILAAVAQRFPTYCIHNYCLDRGAIGGSYADSDEQGTKGGQLVARVLAGEKPENIPVVQGTAARARVDWRQLVRWNIAESALPANTLVLYRQPTVWERYWRYIVAGIAIIVVQSLLIIGLLWLRARKRKAEAVLRESEERFRAMTNTVPSLVWMCDKDFKVTYLNDRRLDFTDRDSAIGLGDAWKELVHPDDFQSIVTANARALEQQGPFSKEFRLRRRDGEYRWMFDVASPRKDQNGAFAGFIGSAVDVTDQRLAQQALEQVSGKLIEAQETERTRIARELHDDICQRLGMLSFELDQASAGANGSGKSLREMRERCTQIARDVQSLSHGLHSSKLEYLGIVAALRAFCEEFSKQHSVKVDFAHLNMPSQLPRDVSLCLFRTAQEALTNAAKHSGQREFEVRLFGDQGEIELNVEDAGVGFDVQAAKRGRGLGLISMQERVHLVKGSISIESKPNGGTRVVVRVPVDTTTAQAAIAASLGKA